MKIPSVVYLYRYVATVNYETKRGNKKCDKPIELMALSDEHARHIIHRHFETINETVSSQEKLYNNIEIISLTKGQGTVLYEQHGKKVITFESL